MNILTDKVQEYQLLWNCFIWTLSGFPVFDQIDLRILIVRTDRTVADLSIENDPAIQLIG